MFPIVGHQEVMDYTRSKLKSNSLSLQHTLLFHITFSLINFFKNLSRHKL